MLRSCRSLAAAYFLKYTRAAQSGASVCCLVPHASIVLLGSEDRFDVAKSNTHPRAYTVQFLAFESQHVCQKGFNAIIHRFCPDVVPELSGDLTVGWATADYPAMGFNKRKMEDRRRKAAEQEAAARRALGPQIIEDSVKLVEAWNARQAAHMPMLFSPTIRGGHYSRLLVPAGALPGLPHHWRLRLAAARLAPRRGRDGAYPGAVMPIVPAECSVR